MLKEADVEKIEKQYGIPGLVQAYKATEEADIAIPEGVTVITDDDLKKVKTTEYNNGKAVAVEMAVKTYKEESGLDFQGKSIEGLVKAAQAKAIKEAGKEPTEQVKQLQADLEKVQSSYKDLETKLTEKDGIVTKATTDREIYRSLPSLGENAIGVDKVVSLMRTDGYDFKIEDGILTPYLNGAKVTDKLSQVIPAKEVITGYAKENKLVTDATIPPKGRGGSDGPPTNTFTKLSELSKHYKESGKSTNGDEFLNKVAEMRKANPDFDLNS